MHKNYPTFVQLRPSWTPVRHLYPWGHTIERILQSVSLPPLDGPVIYISSDYGGSNECSLYETYSVLYLDLKESKEWEWQRREVRARYLADGRRMSFKALNDRQRQAAIGPFLNAANRISGILVTIAVRKSIKVLCSDFQFFEYSKSKLALDPRMTLPSFERMLRIVNLLGLLMGGLAKPNQHVYWISDQDALFANPNRTNDLKNVLEHWTSHYVTWPLGEVGLGTTIIDEGDRVEEDLKFDTRSCGWSGFRNRERFGARVRRTYSIEAYNSTSWCY